MFTIIPIWKSISSIFGKSEVVFRIFSFNSKKNIYIILFMYNFGRLLSLYQSSYKFRFCAILVWMFVANEAHWAFETFYLVLNRVCNQREI